MSDRTHNYWSIGEVLSLLQDEFPEVTISKIRFLESQGLIDPERTPSGYRRFYQGDFDRLQWILTQQRDHYLPLKVIRDRLDAGEWQPSTDGTDAAATPAVGGGAEAPALADVFDIRPTESADPATAAPLAPASGDAGAAGELLAADGPVTTQSAPAPTSDATAGAAGSDADPSPTAAAEPDRAPARAGADTSDSVRDEPRPAELAMAEVDEGVALTLDELAEASGCDVATIRELERFHLVSGRTVGPTVLYDGEALTIARHAAQFRSFGLDPRHLRTFLVGAEREVSLLAQVVEPMRHRRDPEARRKSMETMEDLTDLAASLRAILMRQITREQLPPS